MNETPWIPPQRELFPTECPSATLLTEERREALIPLLSIIVAAAMTCEAAATGSDAVQGNCDDG